MPDQPQSFDELVDALREHPEWRRNLRDVLSGVDEPEPPPPPPGRKTPAWLGTLAMGVLLGGVVAGVAAFLLLRDDDDDAVLAVATAETGSATLDASASATVSTTIPGAQGGTPQIATSATPTPTAASGSAQPSVSGTPTPGPATTTPTPAPPQPTSAPRTVAPGGTAVATPVGPQFNFAGFEGTCAPVSALVTIANVTQPITMDAIWTGPTTITVGPLTIAPPAVPGSIVNVRFPTVAPLTPGTYNFTANADGVVVAAGSVNISC